MKPCLNDSIPPREECGEAQQLGAPVFVVDLTAVVVRRTHHYLIPQHCLNDFADMAMVPPLPVLTGYCRMVAMTLLDEPDDPSHLVPEASVQRQLPCLREQQHWTQGCVAAYH